MIYIYTCVPTFRQMLYLKFKFTSDSIFSFSTTIAIEDFSAAYCLEDAIEIEAILSNYYFTSSLSLCVR